jgi:hypothetical protein
MREEERERTSTAPGTQMTRTIELIVKGACVLRDLLKCHVTLEAMHAKIRR